MDRETFLQTMAARIATAGARAKSTESSQSVIGVGAGLAGLAAAYELDKEGYDVTVLEARSRPGGRVRTYRDPFADGLYAEMGAEHVDASDVFADEHTATDTMNRAIASGVRVAHQIQGKPLQLPKSRRTG